MNTPAGSVDEHSNGNASQLRREDFESAAFAIEQDFRRLVDTLERTIELVGATDKEMSLRLSRAKLVAERGVRLSRLVSNLTRKKRA